MKTLPGMQGDISSAHAAALNKRPLISVSSRTFGTRPIVGEREMRPEASASRSRFKNDVLSARCVVPVDSGEQFSSGISADHRQQDRAK